MDTPDGVTTFSIEVSSQIGNLLDDPAWAREPASQRYHVSIFGRGRPLAAEGFATARGAREYLARLAEAIEAAVASVAAAGVEPETWRDREPLL